MHGNIYYIVSTGLSNRLSLLLVIIDQTTAMHFLILK